MFPQQAKGGTEGRIESEGKSEGGAAVAELAPRGNRLAPL